MTYRADVDGLRAVAVIPVLLFHAGFAFMGGGYVGVDVFFVISGYLITSIIVREIREERFSIAVFYRRRALRILPAFVATAAVTAVFAVVLLPPRALVAFGESLVAASLFASNVYFWRDSGYFALEALNRPLLHTWSLSVEEQFYIFAPIGLILVHRYARAFLVPAIGIGALASLGLSVALTDTGPTANFFLLPTRAWELMVGSLLAVAPLPAVDRRPVREGMAFAGLLGILLPAFLYSEATPFPGLFALPPVLGTALIIHAGRCGPSLVGRGLSWRPLVVVGLASYSLYLVHWPVLVLVRFAMLRDPTAVEAVGILALSVALGFLSWRYVERPFRAGGPIARRRTILAPSAAALAAAVLAGWTAMATGSLLSRAEAEDGTPVADSGLDEWNVNTCFLIGQDYRDWQPDDCVRTTGAAENALLWGDSFAAHYVPGVLRNADRIEANIIQYTFAGCPPVLAYYSFARPNCQLFNERAFEIIEEMDVKHVILAARWDQLREGGVGGLKETLDRLAATGVDIYVIGRSPMFAFSADVLETRDAGLIRDDSAEWSLAFPRSKNAELAEIATTAAFIDPLESLCRNESHCLYREGPAMLYAGQGHFSVAGSDRAVRSYFPLLADRGREVPTRQLTSCRSAGCGGPEGPRTPELSTGGLGQGSGP